MSVPQDILVERISSMIIERQRVLAVLDACADDLRMVALSGGAEEFRNALRSLIEKRSPAAPTI